jgi:hypothetical protein
VTDSPEIAAARVEVDRRRTHLLSTAHELQDRLSPRTLARGAWQGTKEKGADLAEDAVDAVRARPLAATGVVAAIALFLAREPLMDIATKLVDRAKGKSRKRRKPAPGKAEAAPQKAQTEAAE